MIVTWPDERTEGFTLVHADQFNPRVFVRDTTPVVENGDVVDKPRVRIGIFAIVAIELRRVRKTA